MNTGKSIPATPPEDVAKVIAEARAHSTALGLYLWIVVITGARRGELCGLQNRDIDLDQGLIHVAFNYVVKGGKKVRKDTKTHQDRWLAIDPDTCALIANYLAETRAALAAVGAELAATAYLFSNDPGHNRPWNPDWASHKIAAAANAAGVDLDIKGGRPLHRQPAARRRIRPAQHRRTPRPQRRRRDHTAALRRPGTRGRPPRRNLPLPPHLKRHSSDTDTPARAARPARGADPAT